ncbi:hypothetical protein [Rhizobium halophytocola]|uniref:Uncharacterized protein n=1 Tax=Rhizobium halophytocola TaxID=735519 RepID=A0ABS4E0R8_9HYPH|nr:hypothetical protein [Rhizobium halophytocola]
MSLWLAFCVERNAVGMRSAQINEAGHHRATRPFRQRLQAFGITGQAGKIKLLTAVAGAECYRTGSLDPVVA